MADHTINIDVYDLTVPELNPINIAIINLPNPVKGYSANAKQIKDLMQFPQYAIFEAGTSKRIKGTNYYEYFPEEGGRTKIDILWSDSSGAVVGTEYNLTRSINDYDEIVLKVASTSDIDDFNTYDQYSFKVAMIGAGEQIQCTSYGMRYITTTISDNKFTVTRSGATNENKKYTPVLWQIIGIKY